MKYEFVELVGVRVVGLMTRTAVGNVGVTDDVPKLWRDFYRTRVEQCLSDIDSERYRYATVSYGYDRRTEQFNVIVGCFKKPFGRETSGFQKCVVPAGMYAKVEVDGVDPGSISRAWGDIDGDVSGQTQDMSLRMFVCIVRYPLMAALVATATATVAPTIGLLPMPMKPIISTCAGTLEEPANCASECMRPMVSVMP